MTRTTIIRTLAVLGVGAFLQAPARAALFGTIQNGAESTLVSVDTSTGGAAAVGSVGFADVQGLAARESDAVLFGGLANPSNPLAGQMLTISPGLSSSGLALGAPDGNPIGDLARSPGTGVIYATCSRFSASPGRPDALCIVNQLTGVLTMADPNQMNSLDPLLNITNFFGLAFSPSDTLYASTTQVGNPPGEPRLYTVDPSTGSATAIDSIRDAGDVPLNAGVIGMEFVGSVLFASTDDARIITIDPNTAIYTEVGPTGGGSVHGLGVLSLVTPPPTASPTATPTRTSIATPIGCNGTFATNACIPGGGLKTSDCRLEWIPSLQPPLDSRGFPKQRLACYEGDSRCDFDTNLTNTSCTFRVRVCANNTDPRLPTCLGGDLKTFEVRSPRPGALGVDGTNALALQNIAGPGGFGVTVLAKGATVFAGATNATPNLCSAPVDLIVPFRGVRGIKFFRASVLSTGTMDTDFLFLECRKSTCGNGRIDSGESCDDGNRTNGDGCSQSCQIESATPTPTNTVPAGATFTFTLPGATRTPTITPTPADSPTPADTPTPANTPTATIPVPLGSRTFTLTTNSGFFSSLLPTTKAATPAGMLVLDAGVPDASGQATLSVTGPYYITAAISLASQTLCTRIDSCTGTVYCNGGSNVDVIENLDSLKAGLTCVQDGTNSCASSASNFCCSNSCEGVLVGSGNPTVVTKGANPAVNSGVGAALIDCAVRLVTVPGASGVNCATQDYSAAAVATQTFTTGTNTAVIPHHCAGSAAPANKVVSFGKPGQNFSCTSWTSATGPGTIVFSLPVEEPTSILKGDGANVGVITAH